MEEFEAERTIVYLANQLREQAELVESYYNDLERINKDREGMQVTINQQGAAVLALTEQNTDLRSYQRSSSEVNRDLAGKLAKADRISRTLEARGVPFLKQVNELKQIWVEQALLETNLKGDWPKMHAAIEELLTQLDVYRAWHATEGQATWENLPEEGPTEQKQQPEFDGFDEAEDPRLTDEELQEEDEDLL